MLILTNKLVFGHCWSSSDHLLHLRATAEAWSDKTLTWTVYLWNFTTGTIRKWITCFWPAIDSAASNSVYLHQFKLPTGVNPVFVLARCLWELCPWFSLILVERCCTYWINACKLTTHLRTIQRKVKGRVAVELASLINVYLFSHTASSWHTVHANIINQTCIYTDHAWHTQWWGSFFSFLGNSPAGVWSENDRRRGIHVILQEIIA